MFRTTILLLSVSTCATASLSAQHTGGQVQSLHHWDYAPHQADLFGEPLVGGGDLNADGFPDILIGDRGAHIPPHNFVGSVFAFSGADGTLLYRWNGTDDQDNFGEALDFAGDVNGDGHDDVIVGAENMGRGGEVFVLSGADGSTLYHWTSFQTHAMGTSVAGAGDVDGDGFADVLVGDTAGDHGGKTDNGTVVLRSGQTGLVLATFSGQADFDYFGNAIANVGDVDGDGVDDLLAGASGATVAGKSGAGKVSLISMATGTHLHQWNGTATHMFFGENVAAASDVDQDGTPDVMIKSRWDSGSGTTNAGHVRVYSGASGQLLLDWVGSSNDTRLGDSMIGPGDMNGDGHGDLLLGMGNGNKAYLYSGMDGTLLRQWPLSSHYGTTVGATGDLDGDGYPEALIGDPWSRSGGGGYVDAFSFDAFLSLNTATVSASAGGQVDIALDFPDSAASYESIVLMSVFGTQSFYYGVGIPLTLDNYVMDSGQGIYPFTQTTGMHGTLDASGDGTAGITIPAGSFGFAVGRTFHLAAVAFPAGQQPEFSSVAAGVTFLP